MKNFIKIFFALIFLSVTTLVSAQDAKKKSDPTGWKKADKEYQEKGYMASATGYQMKHNEDEMTVDVMSRIANSYRLNGESELAEYWYARCMSNNTNVEDKLYYAEVLQSNGKCEDAIRWYKDYQKTAKRKEKREFITDCSELNSFTKHANIKVSNLKALNSKHLDYSAVAVDGGVMFTSTRGLQKASRTTDNWTKDNFSDVFFAKKNDEGKFSTPTPLGSEINQRFHDGATSVREGGNIMYFSRNNSKSKTKGKIVDLKIYSATRTNKVWKNVKELPFNGDSYATCHPSISSDGKYLFFASDRKEGFGGMDIYVSVNENGKWQTPVNLGPTVNTSGNEIFPFIGANGKLYFSSNGHKGVGGLDIFQVERSNQADMSSWSIRTNIGKPFNTKKDDFGFFTNAEMTEGFLTSNRSGGKGGDDIYEWKSKDSEGFEVEENNMLSVVVADKVSGDLLRNAVVSILDEQGNVVKKNAITNSKGMLIQQVETGKTYKVVVEKEGYTVGEKVITSADISANESISLKMEKLKCIELLGTVLNEKYNKAIPNATVTLLNKCTGERTVVNTHADGTFDLCLDHDCEFEIIAAKDNFNETQTMISTMDFAVDSSPKEIKMEMLPAVKKVTPVVSTPVSETKTTTTSNNTSTSTGVLGSEIFKSGKVVTIKNIYYDYNKFDIRRDARVELDYVAKLMKGVPNMEIILYSHADARGRSEYNQQLSLKRAESAKQYLVSKGINPNQIVTNGYGETQLQDINHDASDRHQINRRTEIKIRRIK